jgi:hypothetical protein
MLKRARKVHSNSLSKAYLRVILIDLRSLASRVQSGDFRSSGLVP